MAGDEMDEEEQGGRKAECVDEDVDGKEVEFEGRVRDGVGAGVLDEVGQGGWEAVGVREDGKGAEAVVEER